MTAHLLRRVAVAAATLPLLATAACGSSGFDDSGSGADSASSGGGGEVTIVGQNFTEADVMTQLYKGLLDDAGFDTEVKNLGARDVYLGPLEQGDVDVAADYLSSMTEALNRQVNGDDAETVATPDAEATLAKLKSLGQKRGVTPLDPAKAEDANAYAVSDEFAQKNDLSTLSDLGRLNRPLSLAANSDCDTRQDCKLGLQSVYGITISKVEPLGFDSPETKKSVQDGENDIAQVATTDATLDSFDLTMLSDDKDWQNAENLVPVVNSEWLSSHQDAAKALDKLSGVLTTEDLTTLIARVDTQREKASSVAMDYLQEKGLV